MRKVLIVAALVAMLMGLTVACHDTGGTNPAAPIYAHCV